MKVRIKQITMYCLDTKVGDIVEARDSDEVGYECLCSYGGKEQWLFFEYDQVELIEDTDGLTWENIKKNFNAEYPLTPSKAFKLDQHYNNTNGSLYKFAQDHELNAYEFDCIKRIVRCRKKGQFKEDLEKTKRVIDLYLKEFEL
jgi:hypothetical protein